LGKVLADPKAVVEREGVSETDLNRLADGIALPAATTAPWSEEGRKAAAAVLEIGQAIACDRRKFQQRARADFGVSACLLVAGLWLIRRPPRKSI